MTIQEKAVGLHKEGYNCAQAVLMVQEETGLDSRTAANVSVGFGGGVRCGEICGSISGGVIAGGLRIGAEHREAIVDFDHALTDAFRERFGAVRCEELKPQGICDELIAFTAEKTRALLQEV